jgi:hypothetical protein
MMQFLENAMEEIAALTPEDAQRLLDKAEPLTAAETLKLLRFLKKANEEVLGKMRQLKSEIGRVARK